MTQTTTTLVTAADYADALTTARRAKTLLCFGLIFVLGTQLTLFFMLRYMPSLAGVTATPPPEAGAALWTRQVFQYAIGLLDFAGLVLPPVLVVILVVMLLVQLVGRLVGTARVTSALCWAVLAAVLLFPWQAVLNNPGIRSDPYASAVGLKVPGVLYTWAEVSHPCIGARFAEVNQTDDKTMAVFHWLRYAAFPLCALVVLAGVHSLSERGVRQAMGPVEIVTPGGADLADQLDPPVTPVA